MKSSDDDSIYEFEGFELDPARRSLVRQGTPVTVNAKAFDLLLMLVANHDRVLSKRELIETVWADQFVEDNNLTVQISALRKTLGEKQGESRFLKTVTGKGYKFIAPVRTVERSPGAEPADVEALPPDDTAVPEVAVIDAALPTVNASLIDEKAGDRPIVTGTSVRHYKTLKLALAAIGLISIGLIVYFVFFNKPLASAQSIAVLPLVNISGDPNVDYLSDGITENLIDDLSKFPDLKVIARSSVFRYKTNDNSALESDLNKVAAELGVQTVLTGRLEQRGDNLLVSVELVNVTDNTQLWGETYNRKIADVFAVQEEIARNIAEKLHVKLAVDATRDPGKQYTENIGAFEDYTLGRSFIHRRTRDDLLTAKGYFENAIDEDGNYALAYAGLAEVYGNLIVRGYMPYPEGRQMLQENAEKAVELDNDLADGHVMKGYAMTGIAPYDFVNGDKEIRRAIELSPSLAIAHLYLSLSLLKQGAYDEGLKEMLKARELDPFSTIIERQVALSYTLKRDKVRAIALVRQADETGIPFTSTTEVDAYIGSRAFDEALAKLAKEKEKRTDDPLLIYSTGMIYAAEGKRAQAEAAIEQLQDLADEDTTQAQWIAKIYAQLGEKEQALSWLEKGAEGNSIGAFYKDEPVWDPIRSTPGFTEILRQLGIKG